MPCEWSEVWKFATTYIDSARDGVGEIGARSAARRTTCAGFTGVDGGNDLVDHVGGAVVINATVVLLDDGGALVAEAGEGVLDVGDGLPRGDVWDDSGKGHGAGSKDSEDGREVHGGEA